MIYRGEGALAPSRPFGRVFLVLIAFGITACTSKQNEAPQAPLSPEAKAAADLLQRGRSIYQTQCIACHNSDPRRTGAIGPEVFGANKELLEARIIRGDYPSGYQPKRNTRSMVPLPHLKNEIDAIHAYLNTNDSK